MSLKKALRTIAFTGLIGLSSCTGKITDSTYDFKGELNDEQIEFKHDIFNAQILSSFYTNKLTVTRKDGKIIKYIDTNNDLILDKVIVEEKIYFRNDVGKEALELAQKQYDGYLKKILEHKQQKAIENIQ